MIDSNHYDYHVRWSAEDEVFVGRVTEFPSLAAHGDSLAEAMQEIQNAVGFVIEDLTQNNESVPEPLSTKTFSGKFNVRLPVELHRKLSIEAAKQKVSLNTLLISKLSRTV